MKEMIEQTIAFLRGYKKYLENDEPDIDVFEWSSELDSCSIRIEVLEVVLEKLCTSKSN